MVHSYWGSNLLNFQIEENKQFGMWPLKFVATTHCANKCAYELSTCSILFAIQDVALSSFSFARSMDFVIAQSTNLVGFLRVSMAMGGLPLIIKCETFSWKHTSTANRAPSAFAQRGFEVPRILVATKEINWDESKITTAAIDFWGRNAPSNWA